MSVMTNRQTKSAAQHPVSSGNPCPFLRALVASGQLPDGQVLVSTVVSTVIEAAAKGEGAPRIPALAARAIAMSANGVDPVTVFRTTTQGVRLDKLRNGPFDKRGVGSRIIDAAGNIDPIELARLKTFASPKVIGSGLTVLGLDSDEINRFMKANLKRAGDRGRLVDRALMNGEWPVLLKVMGKDSQDGRYLSFDDVQTLVVEKRLPDRMVGLWGSCCGLAMHCWYIKLCYRPIDSGASSSLFDSYVRFHCKCRG